MVVVVVAVALSCCFYFIFHLTHEKFLHFENTADLCLVSYDAEKKRLFIQKH
jgi:hypothetical protein